MYWPHGSPEDWDGPPSLPSGPETRRKDPSCLSRLDLRLRTKMSPFWNLNGRTLLTLSLVGQIQQFTIWSHFFSYFSKKTGFDISCKLSTEETVYTKCQSLFSPKETICMKYQTQFPLGKNNKKKMNGRLLKVLSSMLSSVLILIDAQYRKRALV